MKKLLPAVALLATLTPGLRAQTTPPPAWTDHARALPDKLRQVPVGLTLWHTPNPIYPEPNPAQPGGYVWKHSTMLRSEVGELEVVECGSFIWYSEAGWQANMRETPTEFAELFQCPGGRLLPGRTYTFAKNYRYADNAQRLYGGDALWYILAKDKAGKLYKGMGLVETEATVR
ncbi:hypothetical protein HMJ29_01435 [Hymenobacter taeanensis]|uniref:Uncharacterized protein n=1 Tax=Hymenobacter taeanensis TaxID=2735321 RepID=A0A6M6BCW8_9BACT|nr:MULTISPECIES: hypothetical protein [Hymenobacter]QJX45668.1 hypothetical protein HMJ29_01435 [Hymenobacter taeanensis]UOQ79504.1 hypothetical protein MUN83_11630 [Hymenobacter sp. 5414T-23]